MGRPHTVHRVLKMTIWPLAEKGLPYPNDESHNKAKRRLQAEKYMQEFTQK